MKKTIALCLDKKAGELLSYRFGRSKRNLELSYSAKRGEDDGFFINHYFRQSVDYSRIGFRLRGYEYSIFRNYDATEAPKPKYGVIVSKDGVDKARVNCDTDIVDNMKKLSDHLKCDEDSALGC